MTARRQGLGLILRLRPVAFAGAFAIACATATASANDADGRQAIRSSVQFSLQCNATIGTIEDVELGVVAPGPDGTVIVRGTYRQKLGSFGKFGFQAPEATGGVFEGVYQRDRKALKELQFKISIRSGSIPASCLR